VRDLLTSKGQEFAELKRQRGVRATAQSAQEAIRLVMLQTLNRYIPLWHHHLEIGRLHPEPAYALLRQMVAEFSAFSEEVSALGAVQGTAVTSQNLPPYDHEDLWFCFDLATRRLKELVLTMTTGAEAGIRLIYEDRFYKARLEPSLFEGARNRYYLVIDSLIRGPELWDRLQKTGKLSPLEDMPQLLKQALFGLKIDLLPVAPEEFPQRGGNNSYFQIDTNHPLWQRIREKQNIAMYCDLDPNETVVRLYVIRGD
jgi:type VI secretion system ImpJ/VasE family protein